MNRLTRRLILLAACLPFGAATAADFDGSKALDCAPTEAVDLRPGAEIVKARPTDIGAPASLRVEIAHKKIVGPKRVTPIKSIERSDQQILLQGTELGFAWTLALNRQDGAMIITFVDRVGAVVLTGTCTPV